MQLSGYHVNNVIGQGGMATVYRAEHILLKQERALKVMSPELTSQPGFKDSFIREGQIVAGLKHPNIITIYDIEERNGLYFMAMEYLHGGNLEELLATSALSLTKSLRILVQIGSALHHAHQQHLIHRDIKPANILFNSAGDAVLTDFGISKLEDTDSYLTQKGYGIIGTPRYMSPEQTGGEVLNHRSDLYSLALVFYEMLSGERAIKESSTAAIIREHAVSPPPDLPATFSFFQPVLNKALAKKADERYEDIPAFIRAVKSAYAVAIKKDKRLLQEEQTTAKRSSILFRVSLLLVLGGVVGAGVWLMMSPQKFNDLKQQWSSLFDPQQDVRLVDNSQNKAPKLQTEDKTKTNLKTERDIELKTGLKIAPRAMTKKEKIQREKEQQAIAKKEKDQKEALLKEQEEKKEQEAKAKKEKDQKEALLKEQEAIAKKKEDKKKALQKRVEIKTINPTTSKAVFKIVRVAPYTYLYAELGGRKISQIKQGEKLKLIATMKASDGQNWSEIEFKGKQGYVKSKHLKNAD